MGSQKFYLEYRLAVGYAKADPVSLLPMFPDLSQCSQISPNVPRSLPMVSHEKYQNGRVHQDLCPLSDRWSRSRHFLWQWWSPFPHHSRPVPGFSRKVAAHHHICRISVHGPAFAKCMSSSLFAHVFWCPHSDFVIVWCTKPGNQWTNSVWQTRWIHPGVIRRQASCACPDFFECWIGRSQPVDCRYSDILCKYFLETQWFVTHR